MDSAETKLVCVSQLAEKLKLHGCNEALRRLEEHYGARPFEIIHRVSGMYELYYFPDMKGDLSGFDKSVDNDCALVCLQKYLATNACVVRDVVDGIDIKVYVRLNNCMTLNPPELLLLKDPERKALRSCLLDLCKALE